jgi:hypothetical protein
MTQKYIATVKENLTTGETGIDTIDELRGQTVHLTIQYGDFQNEDEGFGSWYWQEDWLEDLTEVE